MEWRLFRPDLAGLRLDHATGFSAPYGVAGVDGGTGRMCAAAWEAVELVARLARLMWSSLCGSLPSMASIVSPAGRLCAVGVVYAIGAD